jgi:hypothetical protein
MADTLLVDVIHETLDDRLISAPWSRNPADEVHVLIADKAANLKARVSFAVFGIPNLR